MMNINDAVLLFVRSLNKYGNMFILPCDTGDMSCLCTGCVWSKLVYLKYINCQRCGKFDDLYYEISSALQLSVKSHATWDDLHNLLVKYCKRNSMSEKTTVLVFMLSENILNEEKCLIPCLFQILNDICGHDNNSHGTEKTHMLEPKLKCVFHVEKSNYSLARHKHPEFASLYTIEGLMPINRELASIKDSFKKLDRITSKRVVSVSDFNDVSEDNNKEKLLSIRESITNTVCGDNFPNMSIIPYDVNFMDTAVCDYVWPEDFVIRRFSGRRCDTYSGFHAELAAALQFPWYYGSNINALDECLIDDLWDDTHGKYYILVFIESDLIFSSNKWIWNGSVEDNLNDVIKILNNTINYFSMPDNENYLIAPKPSVPFRVIFHIDPSNLSQMVSRKPFSDIPVIMLD